MSCSAVDGWDLAHADQALTEALAAVAPRGVSVGCRTIQSGDEALLLAEERQSIQTSYLKRLKASGAVRYIARGLLGERGIDEFPVLRAPTGEPIWPEGIVGSLAHDDDVAVAAVVSAVDFQGLGIDVEPAIPLPADIQSLVRIPTDKIGNEHTSGISDRVLFCAKEAVYKAVYPLDLVILNYEDISVDLTKRYATTTTGRRAELVFCTSPRIVVLAFIPEAQPRALKSAK
ncbi:4'-phosphopantetheinyl transferase [Ochrobactrum sp. MYb15]|uniref:4'-phosphopantetheinyl transferase superfamily protein n=1 Tax=Brucella pituitosa TaxID=571256 RepID=UPI000CFDAFF9|nr:4'-phosphopantetheinyl transferase [Ochrobactrum sp. MYb19]PRA49414.1 4'-phosphopantetheinyl transferase [Ochrobactrum sp. MYb68]PRA64569.1 4'-phosphopantetheinyl transferase [Ochrobactrum sp. MYb18]PRA74919.1 4'-phosphopantetheinyl transferase [Brucella thiophenivorans]PRA89868.1 4'-phosphopantetheinyl transferase [Ochrobactrum sp. MYb14]PRA96900.1 4'-phosphopantetheinyl transferase [Ochrobactrum sp. MYb15]